MKGSLAVQGIKSLVSQLHPQLPLHPRESNRLFNALTSSFRQHLDEVHPRKAGEDGVQEPGPDGKPKSPKPAFHSSATFADRHLQSVLTNPLLAQPSKADRDFANAKADLQKDSSKDPITLLEEYHQAGAATIPIAALCLQTLQDTVKNLPTDLRMKRIQSHGAGRRTLLWLWRSSLYKIDAFTNSPNFMDPWAYFMIMEDLEEYLWEWLRLDTAGKDVQATQGSRSRRTVFPEHRWKGRLLRSMVEAKLKAPFTEKRSADAALNTFFKACDMKLNSQATEHLRTFPLAAAGTAIHRRLVTNPERYIRTSPDHYDQFLTSIQSWSSGSIAELEIASLRLWHPRRPTGQPAYTLLRRILLPPSQIADIDRVVYKWILPPNHAGKRGWGYRLTLQTASLLEEEGLHREAAWLEQQVSEYWPEMSRQNAQQVKEEGARIRALQRGEDEGVQQELDPKESFTTFTAPLRS